MRWSLKLGTFAGIGVFVHWTFFLLLGWLAFLQVSAGANGVIVFRGLAFILTLFGCVVLHEFGHALTAQRFGCQTRDITLLPIGGVARLERIPDDPWQEFLVAIAGPAVNVVIAALLFVLLRLLGKTHQLEDLTLVGGSFVNKLMWINVGLVCFNMLPAFPMDGGRVLRALLATQMTRVEATHIAATVGQFMAILFGVMGFLGGNWILIFIGFFVYEGAQGEARAVEMRAIFQGYQVRDAMIRHFQTLSEHDLISDAARELSAGQQKDFPIMSGDAIQGLILYGDILKALTQGSSDHQLEEFVRRDCLIVDENERLDQVVDKLTAKGDSTLLVQRKNELVGMLSDEHLGQWLMLHSSIHRRPTSPPSQAA